MTFKEVILVIWKIFILSVSSQKIGEIYNLCDTVHVVKLRVGEDQELVSESNSQCWRVVGESERNDRLIRATLQDIPPELVTEASYSCKSKWSYQRQGILIYDGHDPNINDTIVEKCTTDNTTQVLSSQTVFSTQPVLFIKWGTKSPGKINLELVKLTDATRKCRKSTRRTGQIYVVQSVGYPKDYSSDTFDCWLITNADAGSMYEIQIEDIQLANNQYRDKMECLDKINIYAYPLTKSVKRETDRSSERDIKDTTNIRLLHRFCENEKSRYLYLTEGSILITFVTNSLRQAPGFKLNIKIVPLSEEGKCTPLPVNSNTAIGITSPNYPLHYANGLDMCWNVYFSDPGLSKDYSVSVQNEFQELDPLWIKECPADRGPLAVDRIDITSDVESKKKVLASQCGKEKNIKVLAKTSKPIVIRFRSDGFFTKKGFSIQIIPEPKNCKEHFVNMGEVPYDLAADNLQTGGKELCWKLKTADEWYYKRNRPGKHNIKVDIHNATLDNGADCLSSYLRIYDGKSPGGKLLKEYCPNDNTTGQLGIYSITHEVFIRFKSSIRQKYSITVQALREGVAAGRQEIAESSSRCDYEKVKKDDKWDRSVYLMVYGWGHKEFYSGCEIYEIIDPDPNTQILLKIDLIETSFSGVLAGDCMKNYVVIHDGDNLDARPLINVCHDILDGYIVSSGPAMAFLAISDSTKEWFNADTTHVIGGRYGDECISIPIIDSEKYFISSPNHPFSHESVVDICWIAYLKEEDKGKRIIFKTEDMDHLYRDDCKKAKTERSITLQNDENEVLKKADFCNYYSLYMETKHKCRYSEFLKVHFKSTGPPVTTGFYGYFQAVDREVACEGAPPLITRGSIILIFIAIAFFIIIILCILKNYHWGKEWCKPETAEETANATDANNVESQNVSEQQQIASVSEPPSYSHVVQNNEQFPINRASDATGNGLPSYSAAATTNPSQPPANTVSYKPDNPEQVTLGEGSPMLSSSEA